MTRLSCGQSTARTEPGALQETKVELRFKPMIFLVKGIQEEGGRGGGQSSSDDIVTRLLAVRPRHRGLISGKSTTISSAPGT
jgi:hypothetical protein